MLNFLCNVSLVQLSTKRRVTITDFRGKTLVSMREYYYKDGKELPTSKGMGLLMPKQLYLVINFRFLAIYDIRCVCCKELEFLFKVFFFSFVWMT